MPKSRPLGRTILFILALAAIPALLLVVNYMLALEFQHTRSLARDVEHSHQLRSQLLTLLSIHQDIETGERGFVLSNNPSFLQPYEEGRRRVGRAFARLENLARENSEIAAAIPNLRAVSMRRIALSTRVVDVTRRGERDAAIRLVASGAGKQAMDSLRSTIGRLDAIERQSLAVRTAEAERARGRAQLLAFRLQALLAFLLLIAAAMVMRSLAARRNALERYRDLSARQEAIFFSAKDGMLILDGDGIIESLNPAAAKMYGYSPDELIGESIVKLGPARRTREEVTAFFSGLEKHRGPASGRVMEFVALRRDGSTFQTEVAISPVSLVSGTRFLATIRDISERKQVERMKTEFVSTVSHELRTPLTSIAGSLGLLAGGTAGELPDRVMRLIRIALTNSQRLVRLINDILDIEKIESGKIKFDLKWLNLRTVLEQAVQANRAFAQAHEVELVLEPVPDGATVVADEDRLLQVMDNLISNGAKFSPPGETVTISAMPVGERWRINVADRGPGIPDEFRSRIFQKFAQADSSDTRQKGGTGLGLSIVQEIVTRLDGSVSFESVEGQGSVFHVELPAVRQSAADSLPDQAARASNGQPRIIHVDDDVDTLRLVASAFEGLADVVSSPSVREAYAAIQRETFDAAILDVEMGDGSGLELLPQLRDGSRPIPTIVFTVHDADPELTARVDVVLTKSRSSLDQLVGQTLGLVVRGKMAIEADK